MTLKKWLKHVDASSFHCNIYLQYEAQTDKGVWETRYDLIYAGSLYDVPYWLVEYKIEDGEAISFCHSMFEDVDDECRTEGYDGLCIYLQQGRNKDAGMLA